MGEKGEEMIPGQSPLCKAIHDGWEKEKNALAGIVAEHSGEIKDLTEISTKLTMLVEHATRQVDKLSQQQEDDRLDVLRRQIDRERQRAERAEKIVSVTSAGAMSEFYKTKSFELIVRTISVIAVVLTMAAVGMNYFKEYLAVMIK